MRTSAAVTSVALFSRRINQHYMFQIAVRCVEVGSFALATDVGKHGEIECSKSVCRRAHLTSCDDAVGYLSSASMRCFRPMNLVCRWGQSYRRRKWPPHFPGVRIARGPREASYLVGTEQSTWDTWTSLQMDQMVTLRCWSIRLSYDNWKPIAFSHAGLASD